MTAEGADGWMPILFDPDKARDVGGADLDTGKAKRSDDLGELQITAGGLLCIGDDVKGYLDFVRPMVALYVGGMGAKGRNFYNDLFRRYGYEQEAEQIQDLYLDGKKKEAAELIPTDFLEAISLVGPEGYIKDRLAEFAEAGVTHLNVIPVATEGQTQTSLVSTLKELTA